MRYGFFAFDERKTGIGQAGLAYIGFMELNPELGGHERFSAALRDWGLHLLSTGGHAAGLYTFGYGIIEDDNEPGELMAETFVAWDGTRELTDDVRTFPLRGVGSVRGEQAAFQ